jgi:hypothetical protein
MDNNTPQIPRMHLNAQEVKNINELFAILSIFQNIKNLDVRFSKIPYAKRDFAMIRKKFEKLCEQILCTVPDDKLVSMAKNVRNMGYNIGIKSPQNRQDDEFGLWVSFNSLNGLVNAAHETCMLCTKGGRDQHCCPLRQAFSEIYFPPENTSKGTCPYYAGF